MSDVQQIKDAVDIIDLIGERVELKRSGKNWRGLCPFHSEHSPSFFVSDEIQRYKCFGCGASGDVFEFLEQYEGMSFREALEMLAQRTGIELKDNYSGPSGDERELLYEVMEAATKYYNYLLTDHEVGEVGRTYIEDRGISDRLIERYQLGYAMDSWDGIVKYLVDKKKYSIDLLEETGLLVKHESGRTYDRFRGRLIFPLRNHRGQVVGFSGRTLDPEAKTAKYINTPETTLYHKKKLLYGYAEQLSKLREADEVIVTEGEFDVLSSVQAKVQNVVAVKGSALTEQHARRLKRVVSTVILALDADDAGMEATRKAAQVCQQEDLELRVVNLARVPVITEDNWGELREDVLQWHEQGQSGVEAFEAIGKDPDDLARTEPKRWRDMVKETISVYDFFLGYAVLKHDPTDPGGKRFIVDIMAPVLMTLSHAVERDFYIKKLALVLQVRESAVREDLRGSMERQRTGRRRRPQQDAEEQENQPDILSFEPTTRRERQEQYFLFLITQLDRLTPTQRNQFLNYEAATPALQPLYTQVQNALEDEPETLDLDAVASGLEEPQAELLFEIAASPNLFSIIEEADLSEEWKDTRNELQTLAIGADIEEVAKELEQLDAQSELSADDEARQQELLEKIVRLRQRQRI